MSPDAISGSLRELVIQRAGGRCEYCQLSQLGQEATFHIDHILPRARGGRSDANNLALACVSCSLRKGARLSATDPQSGGQVRLFNPREDIWQEHFRWIEGVFLRGLTPIGRATIAALALNRPLIIAIRQAEIALGHHPPS
ncbi:MAG TPA: HNH endonuclease [Candidatus Fraserbacteria bacterium]|nr:HNH endonuclease [Candidatus Fraserbacteria bacterium]